MHDMHTYPHQVFVHLQISFLSPGGGRSWITTSAEWPLGTAMAQNFTTQGTILKIQFEQISYSHVFRTVIIYIHFLEVVEKWFLGWIPLAGVFPAEAICLRPAVEMQAASSFNVTGVTGIIPDLYCRHEKTFGIWHSFCIHIQVMIWKRSFLFQACQFCGVHIPFWQV